MKALFTFSLFLIVVMVSFSQNIKFKEVSKEELLRTHCELDSSAIAEFVYNELKVSFEYIPSSRRFVYYYQVHQRIKIYEDIAQELLGVQHISLKKNDDLNKYDKLSKMEAYVWNIKDDEIEEVKFEKDSIKTIQDSEYSLVKGFNLPSVKKGSVIDLRYTIVSPFIYSVDRFYIQKFVPVKQAHIRLEIPEYYIYNHNFNGSVDFETELSTKTGRSRVITVRGKSSRQKRTYEEREYRIHVTDYSAYNILPLEMGPYVGCLGNYFSSISLELKSSKSSDGKWNDYNTTWQPVVDRLLEDERFGSVLERRFSEYDDFLDSIKLFDDKQRIRNIYHMVRDTFTWDENSSKFIDKGMDSLLINKVGNSAEINLLLVNLLKESGIKVYPLLIRNAYDGFLNITHANFNELNYVLALVKLDDKWIYLDATDKFKIVGDLSMRALNQKGIAIINEGYSEVPIINNNLYYVTKQMKLSLSEEGIIEGTTKTQEISHLANFLWNFDDGEKKRLVENFDSIGMFIYTDIYFEPLSSISDELIVTAEVRSIKSVKDSTDKMYIPFVFDDSIYFTDCSSKGRGYPLVYENKVHESTLISLTIPEGYEIEYIPETMNISLPDKMITFQIEGKLIGRQIIVTIRHKRNVTTISNEYYTAVKYFYQQAREKILETIILTKV